MIIGVPRETKNHEYRVGLTPEAVKKLTGRHVVLVEYNAGLGSGYSEDQYKKAGAAIADSAGEVYASSEMIVKVKEPIVYEFGFLRYDQMIFAFFHFPPNRGLREIVKEKTIRAVPYENIQLPDGSRPVLSAMSAVAGEEAVDVAAHYLRKENGGKGKLLKGTTTVVVGCEGAAGRRAFELLFKRGARVIGFDVRKKLPVGHGNCLTRDHWEKHCSDFGLPAGCLKNVDAVICAAARKGEGAPKLITREMVSEMEPGSVLVDISVDEGGCSETSRATTHDKPIYMEEGVIHYCVANMPGVVPHSSTPDLVRETFSYIKETADMGWDKAIGKSEILKQAVGLGAKQCFLNR